MCVYVWVDKKFVHFSILQKMKFIFSNVKNHLKRRQLTWLDWISTCVQEYQQ